MFKVKLPKLPVALEVALAVAVALSASFYLRKKRRRLPPGPPLRPLLGLSPTVIPRSEPWKTYAEWAKQYGDVLYFHILGRPVIILSSFAAVHDLLNKRADIYSDRPFRPMYDGIMGRATAVFDVQESDPRFRAYRTLLNGSLNPRAVRNYAHVQETQAQVLLEELLRAPEKFHDHARRATTAAIMQITYGYTVEGEDDYFVALVAESFRIAGMGITPGRWLVDAFPILRFVPSWFPGAGWKRQGLKWRAQLDEMNAAPFNWTKAQMAQGTAAHSFTAEHLAAHSAPDPIIYKCAAALYVGGSDTIVSALQTFFLQMTLNPRVQRKAQAEVDAVTGGQRLPTLEDAPRMPYVHRVIQEVLRIAPVTPVALPHRVSREDEYRGYTIPKEATVWANVWALFRDADVFPEPETFNPDRAFDVDPVEWVFGFGKRICPGQHFAMASLFLGVASVLAAFNIQKHRDGTGREVEPVVQYTTGITSHVLPFECNVTVRSEAARALVLAAAESRAGQ